MPRENVSGVPSGVGIFARALVRASSGTPAELARRARDHRVSFVPLLAVWHDEKGLHTRNDRAMPAYADALRAADVDVWVWGYPHALEEERFVDALVERARRVGARGVILDPEVSYKGRPRAMERLVRLTIDAVDESLGIGFTSYGLPAVHRTFPWAEAAGVGWGSPQVYSTPVRRALEAVDAWGRLGWTSILPALPTFGARSTPSLLNEMVDALVARDEVKGLLFWSWNTTDARDLRTIARAADALDARAA